MRISELMRVLHVYRTYFPDPPGGLQEAIRQICLATARYGVENTIFTLSPQPEPAVLLRPEARVVRCRSWAAPASCDLGGVDALLRFRALAAEADVIHYLFPWPFADLLHQCVRPRRPAMLTYVSDIVRQKWLGAAYAPLMARTLRGMTAIVANSPAYAETSPVLSAPDVRRKLQVIPLGIDEASYPRQGDASILDRLGLASGAAYFLFLGVLRYYKGLHGLVQAARQLGAHLVIAGTGPEGEALRELARSNGTDQVIFAGQVTDEEKVALLQHCRALVLPSHLRSEAFGMVLVEAAMFGKPMVSCELGTGTSYVNADGETGFVVAPGDPAALVAAMKHLLHDDALALRMGDAARQRYRRLFSGEALGRDYTALYRKVAGHPAPTPTGHDAWNTGRT